MVLNLRTPFPVPPRILRATPKEMERARAMILDVATTLADGDDLTEQRLKYLLATPSLAHTLLLFVLRDDRKNLSQQEKNANRNDRQAFGRSRNMVSRYLKFALSKLEDNENAANKEMMSGAVLRVLAKLEASPDKTLPVKAFTTWEVQKVLAFLVHQGIVNRWVREHTHLVFYSLSVVQCPSCGSGDIKRNGVQSGSQVYVCRDCSKLFRKPKGKEKANEN